MNGIPVIMANREVTVDAIQGIPACRIEKVGIAAIYRQGYREQVLMTSEA
jgi:hypothetical protein